MSGAEWITDGDPGAGSEFRVTARALGYTFKFELEGTEWDPPHSFAYTRRQGPVLIDSFMECPVFNLFRPDG